MSMLNWRRDPAYEQRIWQYEQHEMQHKMLHEQRMKQLEKEIEQLDRENARLETLLSCVDRLCFPRESSSIPQPSTKSDCEPSCG